MKVIIFGKIVGVICSLIMFLSGRSQANVNPEPAHNEDNSSSEVRIPIDNLESMLNGSNVSSEVESASPAGDVSKAASSASEVSKTASPINGADQPPSSTSGVKRLRSPSYFSQSDISESDEGYSSDDDSWSSSESEESFSGDEGRALAELNESCGYPRDYEGGLNRSEVISLRQYFYRNLTESESEEDRSSSKSELSSSDD